MSKRFMRVKRVTIPVLTAILIAAQLTGCSRISNEEMVALIDSDTSITIELAEPSTYVIKEQKGEEDVGELDWIFLDQNKSFNSMRIEMDRAFNINTVTHNGVNGKSGVLFVDGTNDRNSNTTLMDACRNKVFCEKYWTDGDVKKELMAISAEAYSDTAGTDNESLMATINAYYDILPDEVNPDSFNGTQSLTREEYMTLLYRATNPVSEAILDKYNPDEDAFTLAVGGQTRMTVYAKEMNDYSWLKYQNSSLEPATYNGEITRAEAVYMVVQQMFKDKYEAVDISVKELNMYVDAKNYGDLALDAKYKIKDKETKVVSPKDRWEAYTLDYMVKNPDKGMQEELYKALVVAHQLNLLDVVNNESRWDEPISKTEALQLVINAGFAANTAYGYASDVEYGTMNESKFAGGNGEAVVDEPAIVDDPNKKPQSEEEFIADTQPVTDADMQKAFDDAKASGKYGIVVYTYDIDGNPTGVLGMSDNGDSEMIYSKPIPNIAPTVGLTPEEKKELEDSGVKFAPEGGIPKGTMTGEELDKLVQEGIEKYGSVGPLY